jgi:hypothetical protein
MRKLSGLGKMVKGNFIVGSVNKMSGAFSTSANPYQHETYRAAAIEAEKLSRQNPEKKFVVLKIKGTVSTATTVWE